MVKKNTYAILLIFVLAAILFTGCASSETSQTSSTQPTGTQTSNTAQTQTQTATQVATTGTPTPTPTQTTTATSSAQSAAKPEGKKNVALDAELTAKSTVENAEWGLYYLIDEDEITNGYSSNDDLSVDHEEWIQFEFSEAKISQINLYPRQDTFNDIDMTGDGFPVDFTIDISMDGKTWTTVKKVTNAPKPTSSDPVIYTFDETSAKFVRINATSIRILENDFDNYRMQFFEVEIYGVK